MTDVAVSAELEGVPELIKQLRDLKGLDDGKILRAAGRDAAKIIVERAQALIPVNKVNRLHRTYKGRLVSPGFAKRSIRSIVVLSKDKQKVSVLVGVRKEAFYAVSFVEAGTSQMGAQPWLRPALKSTAGQQQKALAEGIKKGIDRLVKKSSGKGKKK